MKASITSGLYGVRSSIASLEQRVASGLDVGDAPQLLHELETLRDRLDALAATASAAGGGELTACVPVVAVAAPRLPQIDPAIAVQPVVVALGKPARQQLDPQLIVAIPQTAAPSGKGG